MRKYLYPIIVLLLFSCQPTQIDDLNEPLNDYPPSAPININEIPLCDALSTLQSFFDTVYPETKSVVTEKIGRIETHYSKSILTKSGSPFPDAYIINFLDEQGYAILGANTSVSPIIAVTNTGNLEENFLDQDFTKDIHTTDIEGNDFNLSTFNSFSDEYDDYYVMIIKDQENQLFFQESLMCGIENEYNPPIIMSGGTTQPYVTVSPMLKTTWDQGEWDQSGVYNQFCYKERANGKIRHVLTGCSTTAMAGIVAYNQFPTELHVLGEMIDYNAIQTLKNAELLSSSVGKGVGLLMGSIYHSVKPLFSLEAGTCITAEQIKRCMSAFGYLNVIRHDNTSFDYTFKNATSSMLAEGKPVYVSAIHNLTSGHSWVIDGAVYVNGIWLVNCNWGWSGLHDGYFSTDCFNPRGYTYDKHLRLITYDIPSYTLSKYIDF